MKRLVARIMLILCGFALHPNRPAMAAGDRPFKLSASGTSSPNPDGTVGFTMSGTATHLGRWTAVGEVSVQPTENPAILAYTGSVTFVAANGDQLEVAIENGQLDLTTGVGTALWRIITGTGRFSDATGSAEGRSDNYPDGSFDLRLEGNISY